MTKRRTLRRNSNLRKSSRKLNHETLEKRELLAAEFGPRLISVAANSGEQFDIDGNNQLAVSPTELTFRFDGGQELDPVTLSAFRFTASGGDGGFEDGNEVEISPGFIGLGETSRIVIARFASDLPDDIYRIQIAGYDDTDPNDPVVALRNTAGDVFAPLNAENPDQPTQDILMNIEVGPRVVAVVPQPITGTGASRVQHRDQVYVFFNNDALANPSLGSVTTTGSPSDPSVVRPEFYNLFFTGNTIETGDDGMVIRPESITYEPALNRATLTFTNDLSELAGAAANGGSATYRLRVGSSQALPLSLAPDASDRVNDVADTFIGARDLGVDFGSSDSSLIVSGEIEPTSGNTIQWPGINAPGVREDRRDAQVTGRADTNDGVDVFHYNFANLYGTDAIGLNLENAITPAQQQRTREILDLYSEHLGVQFIETEDRGLQIVTGDLRALVETATTGPGAPFQEYRVNDDDPSRGVLILDAGENWFDGYGLSPDARPSWFVEALRGVGSLLGIGNTFEQVPGVASGSNPDLYNPSLFPNPDGSTPTDFSIEPDFLSSSDIVPGQALHRPEIRDADLYSFNVAASGRISIETFAQRLLETSLLDTDLKLWKFDPDTAKYELVARNADFYGDDSFIGVDVDTNADGSAATYVLGITAAGNDEYNPDIAGSGGGGRTQGVYDMRITFQRDQVDTIMDTNGSRLDGDSDGRQGGDFNFWFRTAKTKDTAVGAESRTLFVNSSEGFNASANGTIGSPYQTIDFALAQARPGDIVRLLPDGGADGQVGTTADNRAYEIGRGGSGNGILADGESFEVPKGVTVMIDAGAILKLRNAKVSVGSESIDEDRSLAGLQVVGSPVIIDQNGAVVSGEVQFTSYNEESRDGVGLGIDTNLLPTTANPGDWAGIEFRNDFDYSEGRPVWETEGIFIDYVSHADIRYGGGNVSLTEPIVTPLQMLDSRPTLIYNQISLSRDAAMSADPNSFAETNFHAPLYQQASLDRYGATFTSDYDRVGPHIRGNEVVDNSINGLFVRVLTPAVGEREPMTVSGRFDDRDITHTLSEVLVLQGQPGGPQLLEQRPDVLNVTVAASSSNGFGTLPEGDVVDYRITFVTEDGFESLASIETRSATVSASGVVVLDNLPAAPAEYAGRKLYRLNSSGDYTLVEQLDRGQEVYTDRGQTRGGILSDAALATGDNERLLPRVDARLSIDPGIVLKLDTARIEATFGADFYAEGVDGSPVVFTSRLDDRFGAGGTFDTNNDGDAGVPTPGDWSGLVFRQGSSASIDHAVITYGGGDSAVSGGFDFFNAVEILQSDVRIANSTLVENASGNDGVDFSTRDGVGFNGPATIFVRGSQPTIVNNTIISNEGAALSINPDALNYISSSDHGRGTGDANVFATDADNQGPLIAANQLDDNSINGMLIRNESLTTESVWDDTDIVHVVEGQVYAWNHHQRSSLRLKSDPNQSLVVKFQDGGGITADRVRTDIDDSIGGTLQVLGQAGFPVIMTSVHDCSVGSGFTPEGIAQNDTLNEGLCGAGAEFGDAAPGDWYGITIDAGANDRNVAFIPEAERAVGTAASVNAIPSNAQKLGSLARDEFSADENRRLGFNVRGTLSESGDIDVYNFTANGGTEVFIDIDDTDFGLDTVVEIIDVNGNILALSDNSDRESVAPDELVNNIGTRRVLSLLKDGEKSVENPNALDAGMRVILPGNSATVNDYYVRVRSSNLRPGDSPSRLTDPVLVGAGQSSGQYQLSLRLRETDEIAGSTVRLADIRFATNPIDVAAAPLHSPLAAEHAEELAADGTDNNDSGTAFDGTEGSGQFTNASADPLGSLNASDRGVLRVSGVLGNQVLRTNPQFGELSEMDLDVYRINLLANEQEPDIIGENRFVTTVFDIDYADQLGRANTSISVYDASGRLILHSRDSNVADDQGRPNQGNDMDNLSAGSAGTLDAYIGPVELQEGTYYVVVSSAQMIPESMNQLFQSNPAATNVRVLPIDSVRNIAEEGFDSVSLGVNTAFEFGEFQQLNQNAEKPTIAPFFDETSIVPYKLEDVRLFLTLDQGLSGNNQSSLITVDPFTGQLERTIGQWGQPVGDLAIRRDGELFAYTLGPTTGAQTNGNTGNYLNVSSADASVNNVGDDGLTFNRTNGAGTGMEADPNAQLIINAMAFDPQTGNNGANTGNNPTIPAGERMYAVGNRDVPGRGEIPDSVTRNVFYEMVANSGAATNQGSTNGQLDRNFPNAPYSEFLGPASNKFEFGVVDTGQFIDSAPDPDGNFVDGGDITGLAINPNPAGFGDSFFAVTDGGYVYTFDPSDTRQVDADPADPSDYGGFAIGAINATNHGLVTPVREDSTSFFRGNVEFTSLTLGPRLTEGGRFAQTLFGVTNEGWIYTMVINETTGRVDPAPVLYNGNHAIQIVDQFGGPLGVSPTGVAFSTREENPWHQTTDRSNPSNDHGVFNPHDDSRIRTFGGSSLYFGMEIDGNEANNTIEGGNGTLNPGGVHGSTVSRPFSLEGYASGDKPTLYFSYFLETEANADHDPPSNNGIADQQVDAFRVFAAGDDGQWRLVSTNDTWRSFSNVPSSDEYDYFGFNGGIPVQENFENTDEWRQARVDLSPLAGHKNVQLRFDFSTAGGMHSQFVSNGYLTEVQAVAGTDVVEGSTFTMFDQIGAGGSQTFEFVRGASVDIPSPATILNGQQLSFTDVDGNVTTIELRTNGSGAANQISFSRSDSASDLAIAIQNTLNSLNPNLVATAFGSQLRVSEAESFSLTPERFGATAITIPSDVSSFDGQSLSFVDSFGETTTLRLTTGAPASDFDVNYSAGDSPAAVASAIANQLAQVNTRLPAFADGADQLVVFAASDVTLGAAFGTPTSANRGTTASQDLPNDRVPIFYSESMTSQEVRDAIRAAFVNGLAEINESSEVSNATLENFPEYATNRIRVFNYSAFGNTSAIGFSDFLPGDEFGAATSLSVSNNQVNTRPAANNNVEGVYLDDIVVGFAERGEVVLNAPSNRNFDVLPETRTFTYTDTQQPEYPNEILVGGYTLEVRTASDYGVAEDYDPIRLALDEQFGLGRSFDTNDRLTEGVTLVTPSGADLVDGDTFTLSNGSQQLTFEFDSNNSVTPGRVAVPFTPAGIGAQFSPDADETDLVARSVRDAINSPQAFNVLGIFAAGSDSRDSGVMTGNRVELFGDDIQVNPSSGRFIKIDLVDEETFYGRESARTLPEIDHDNQLATEQVDYDTLARATVTPYVNGMTDTLVAVGKIGDHVGTGDANELIYDSPYNDEDIVKIFLNAGDIIDVDLDTVGWTKGTEFNAARLEIFDEREFADPNYRSNIGGTADGETNRGAWIDNYVAQASGYYYVRVSSVASGFFGSTDGFGDYQLTIRPGGQINRDVMMADYHFDKGDANRFRDQGQIIIESNFISNFAGIGVRASFDPGQPNTDNDGNFSSTPLDRRPGAAALLRNDNTDRLLPGTVITNNVVIADGATGISFSGEVAANGDSPAPVPFGRIYNNTLVGTGSGTGVNITSAASPTVLNNVVSGFDIGLRVLANSDSTVVGGNAYQDNNTNSTIPLAASSFVIPGNVPLFQDPDGGVYIPAAGSQVIDSSFASLNDRSDYVNTVKQPVGISSSPIIAPSFDAYGIPRLDDPDVTTPGGVGSNVFIDRGAIDRADFVRPKAALVSPLDFISGAGVTVVGGDVDPSESFVRLVEGTVEFFEIQLFDPSGSGPDARTITVESVILTEDGRRLTPGVDYTFGYSDNSRLIRLTPLAGLWRTDAVYEITLNNQDRLAYEAPAGDEISDGDQVIVTDNTGHQTVFEFESGYAVEVPQTTLLTIAGPNSSFQDRDTFTITAPNGNSLNFEINLVGAAASGNVTVDLTNATTIGEVRQTLLDVFSGPVPGNAGISIGEFLDLAPIAVGSNQIQLGTLAGHAGPSDINGLTVTGQAGGVVDGESFVYSTPDESITFEFDSDGTLNNEDNEPVSFLRTSTPGEIAEAIVEAVQLQAVLGLSGAAATADGEAVLGGEPADTLDVSLSSLAVLGVAGVTPSLSLEIPSASTGASLDGTTFMLDVDGTAIQFRYTTNSSLTSPDRLILLGATDLVDAVAAKTSASIAATFAGQLDPSATANIVTLGEPNAIPPQGQPASLTRVDGGSAGLIVGGVSGGAVAIPFLPNSPKSSIAATLQAGIVISPLEVTTFSPGGGTILVSGAASIQQSVGGGAPVNAGVSTPAIADLSGNPVSETRVNNETRFTIIMPEVVFDFGDAEPTYGTLLSDNGARHTINGNQLPRLGEFIDSEVDGQIVNQDDRVVEVLATQNPVISGVFDIDPVTIPDTTEIVLVNRPLGGETLRLTIDGELYVFEFVEVTSNPTGSNFSVPFTAGDTLAEITTRLVTTIRAVVPQTDDGLLIAKDTPTSFLIRTVDDEDGVSAGIFTRMDQSGGVSLYNVFTLPGTDPNNPSPDEVLGFLNPLDPAGTNIAVNVAGAGLLHAWIDFDHNGTFEPDEQVLSNLPVSGDADTGSFNFVTVFTPDNAIDGDTWMRVRISESGNLSPTGVVVGGEVEDYRVEIISIPLPDPDDDNYTIDEDAVLDTVGQSLPPISDGDYIPPEAFLPVQYIVGDLPVNGTLVSLDATTGHFVYEPNADFNGVDTFTYRLSTQQNASANSISLDSFATVTISVLPINDVPGGTDKGLIAQEDLPLIVPADQLLADATGDADPQYVSPGSTPTDLQNEDLLNEQNQTDALGISAVQGTGGAITAANSASAAGNLVVTSQGTGLDIQVSNATDGDFVSVAFAGVTATFELVAEDSTPQAGTVPVQIVAGDTPTTIATRLMAAIEAEFAATVPPVMVGQSGSTVSLTTTPEVLAGSGSATFSITPGAGSLAVEVTGVPNPTAAPTDGEPNPPVGDTFTLDVAGSSLTFELLSEGATAADGNIGITLRLFTDPSSDAARASVAAQLASAVHAEMVAADLGVVASVVNGASDPYRVDIVSESITAGKSFETTRGSAIALFNSFGDLMELRYISGLDLNRDNPPPATPLHTDEFTFTVRDNGVSIDLINNGFVYGPSESGVPATATIDVAPQNDVPFLRDDFVTAGPLGPDADTITTDWETFGGATPTEDQALVIDPAFLLLNDSRARMTAADEDVVDGLNDTGLTVTGVTMVDPAQGTVELINGEIVFTPADDLFGDIVFMYSAQDEGVDEGVDGSRPVVPLTSFDGLVTVSVQPVNDAPVAYDRGLTFVESAEPGTGAPYVFTSDQLIDGAMGETPAVPGDFDPALTAPFNESEQTLRVVSFATAAGSVDVSDLTGVGAETLVLASDAGGQFEFDFVDGIFTEGRFTSAADYNERTPFAPVETFTYVISDDGLTTSPQTGGQFNLPDARSDDDAASLPATVTINVTDTNDAPTFNFNTPDVNGVPTIDVLERDDNLGTVVDEFVVNILPGPESALDEIERQTVFFTFPEALNPPSNIPDGLFTRLPEVSDDGQLIVYPAPDAIGSAIFVVVAEDREPGNPDFVPRQTLATFAVNVQPVNDAPRFDLTVAGDSDMADPDEAYSVAVGTDIDGDGYIDSATITYTLREDNTQAGGDISEDYFIPLNAAPSVGYSRIGLLDVFTVGPDNEAADLPGGSQIVEFFEAGNDPLSPSLDRTTDRGGVLTPVFDSSNVLIGLNYRPPLDFNVAFAGVDSFTYIVRDDSTTGGETFSLEAGALVPDQLTTENRVELVLNPVNDRPEFTTETLDISIQEDASEVRFLNYASNISAGPPNTAFDEVDVNTGQLVEFSVTSLDFPQEDSDSFFSIYPSIDEQTGLLNFEPADDVFGEYRFELVLTDRNRDGSQSDNTIRGDLISSIPVTLTINVQPVNDPPIVDPNADPLEFTILEDGSIDVLVNGDNTSPGLLDPFFPGPYMGAADESADILPRPGGNQSVSLGTPIPRTSAEGGTIEYITDGGTPRLRYTPRADFVGMDSFIYTVVDDGVTVGIDGVPFDDPRIAANTVTFEVLPVNDAPLFSGAGNVTSEEDQGVVVIDDWATNVQAGPNTALDEIEGTITTPPQDLEFVFTQTSSNLDLFQTPPTAIIDPDTGTASLTYVASPDASGVATFEVVLEDSGPRDPGIGDEYVSSPPRTFTINVGAVNDPPTFDIANDPIFRQEDSGPYSVVQAINISPGPGDEQSQTVTFEVEPLPPEFASLFVDPPTINSDGVLRFTPATNQNTDNVNGPAVIRVVARDSDGAVSSEAEFEIHISEVNDPPRAVPDSFDTDEDTFLQLHQDDLIANDIDPDLETNPDEVIRVVMPPVSQSVSGATVRFDETTGEITYDPIGSPAIQSLAPGETLIDSFAYSLVDLAGAESNRVTVALNVAGINDAPNVRPDTPQLSPEGSTTIDVLENDTDVDGVLIPSSVRIALQPAFGSVVVQPDGTVVYSPFSSFSESDIFSYTVADNLNERSEEAFVTISANASPIAADDLHASVPR